MLYLMPLRIEVSYKQENKENRLVMYIITLFGLIRYKVDLTFLGNKLVNLKGKLNYKSIEKEFMEKENRIIIQGFKQSTHKVKENYQTYKTVMKYFLDKIKIEKFYLNTQYGLENAAITGILSGILYSIQSNILILVFQYKNIKDCQIRMIPLFQQQNIIRIDFSCIIQFKLGHIINGSIRSLILYKRR